MRNFCAGAVQASGQRRYASRANHSTVPDDVQKAAEKALGSETEVLLYGDLARNGAQEALAINRMKQNPKGGAPGTVITRAVILQKDAGTWKEILRCDEHLENPKGYLGNIPLAPVNGWRLQYEQDAQKGWQVDFTPVADPKGARALPIEVRWNSKVKRYQSLDRNFENFLGEFPSLETPETKSTCERDRPTRRRARRSQSETSVGLGSFEVAASLRLALSRHGCIRAGDQYADGPDRRLPSADNRRHNRLRRRLVANSFYARGYGESDRPSGSHTLHADESPLAGPALPGACRRHAGQRILFVLDSLDIDRRFA